MSIGFIYFFIFSKIRVQYLHTATAVIIHLFSHSQTLCLWHKFAISPYCYRSYHPFILPLANFVPMAQIYHISILLPQLLFIYSPTRKLCAYGTNLPYLHSATAVIIHLFSHSQTLCLWHKFAISPYCYRSMEILSPRATTV